jgi:hypothetical protein
LFVTGVGANHEQFPAPPNQLAVFTDTLDAGSNLHRPLSRCLPSLHFEETTNVAMAPFGSKGSIGKNFALRPRHCVSLQQPDPSCNAIKKLQPNDLNNFAK